MFKKWLFNTTWTCSIDIDGSGILWNSCAKIYLLILVMWAPTLQAQVLTKRVPIDIVSLKNSTHIDRKGHIDREYSQDVKIRHAGLVLFCDRAIYNDSTNQLTASGHVRLVLDDLTVIKADTASYQGNEQLAFLQSRVTLQHHETVLHTTQLDYSQQTGVIHFTDRKRNGSGRYLIVSREGHYDSESRQFAILYEKPPIVLRMEEVDIPSVDSVATTPAPTPLAKTDTKPANQPQQVNRIPVLGKDTVQLAAVEKALPRSEPPKSSPVKIVPAIHMVTEAPVNRIAVANPTVVKTRVAKSGRIPLRIKKAPLTLQKLTPKKATLDTSQSDLERLLNRKK